MITKKTFVLLLLLCWAAPSDGILRNRNNGSNSDDKNMFVFDSDSDRYEDRTDTEFIPAIIHESLLNLNTTLYPKKCVGKGVHYITPMRQCYNGQIMYPSSNVFGENDIIDEPLQDTASGKSMKAIRRSFYKSIDGRCTGDVIGVFKEIPTDVCIGPFGEPLPWGTIQIIGEDSFGSDFLDLSE
eukprot:CAMPEP_0197237720 /NCGR_PEP_ID=MMETSP1429-20130617/4472_1 /TAXON_ID=49237 /ORGANISM="Chaetoceros  sp., Strain UNC1202" /LENGTH=183 /DNA_ID=CAMNT_0042696769 /DNA_START=67 /DNA_END=618 /DNA_ORIENTATION=-